MTKYLLIFRQQYSENTPEYGMGDYPAQIDYIGAVVEADTIRKAQNAAKKIYPHIRFGGMFSPLLVETTSKYADMYTKPADPRLTAPAFMKHEAARDILGGRS